MTKLNDLQSILLATAAQRESGSLFPAPDSVSGAGARLTKAVSALVKASLAEERETSDTASVHRADGDLGFGVFITQAGCDAIGVGERPEPGQQELAAVPEPVARVSKASAVLAL